MDKSEANLTSKIKSLLPGSKDSKVFENESVSHTALEDADDVLKLVVFKLFGF